MTIPLPDDSLPMASRLSIIDALHPMLMPEQEDPKQLIDALLVKESLARRLIADTDLDMVDETRRAWLLLCAVYTGCQGLPKVAAACAHSNIAADYLATFFAIAHIRPWRETAYRIGIAFAFLDGDRKLRCQSLIDKMDLPRKQSSWEMGAILAGAKGGEEVLKVFREKASKLGIPQDRIASFARCLD
jgi:hypothetical protein